MDGLKKIEYDIESLNLLFVSSVGFLTFYIYIDKPPVKGWQT